MLNQLKENLINSNMLRKLYKVFLLVIALYISFFVFSFLLSIFAIIACYFMIRRVFIRYRANPVNTRNVKTVIEINPKK